mmetsp:Transcript_46014/g.95717  ORF Transcript_46014/g.95717 Transcript_46014/m.95717 type:complete len:365 (+) Transcript_46014:2-1096(+)
MKDTSLHLREPFVALLGAIFFPLGVIGAHMSARKQVQLLGYYLATSALLHLGLLGFDGIFYGTCDAMSGNMVLQTLTQWPPISPIRPGSRERLEAMNYYPMDKVNEIVTNFSPVGWYFGMAGLWTVFLLYVAWESNALATLLEQGPMGLGVHYGINWDEAINHDAIRRHKERQKFSAFIEDAKMPLVPVDVEEATGYESRGSASYYGAMAAVGTGPAAPAMLGPQAPAVPIMSSFVGAPAAAVEEGGQHSATKGPAVSFFEEDDDRGDQEAAAAAAATAEVAEVLKVVEAAEAAEALAEERLASEEAEAEALRQWVEGLDEDEARSERPPPLPRAFFAEDMVNAGPPPPLAAAPLASTEWRTTM